MKILKFIPANEKQKRFMYSNKRYLMLSGAVGAGKSFSLCWKGLMLNLMYPGNRGLICRKEARSLQGSTIQTLLNILPEEMIIGYNQQKGELIHLTPDPKHNSTIVFSGLDKKADQSYPTKIGSTEYGWCAIDEGVETDEGDWQMLATRIRFKIPHLSNEENAIIPKQMFTATNPDTPYHYLHKFFFESNKLNREAILTTPYDNPYLPPEYIKELESTLTGVQRERLLLGKWVQAEGVIYDCFNRETHLVDDSYFLPIKDYKLIVFGADANFPLPRASIIVGITGEGEAHILDEFYKKSHVEELIEWLKEWQTKREWHIEGYHDPSSPEVIEKINMAGIQCFKADNSVVDGISEVYRYFAQNKIKINKKCVNLIQELQAYRWQKGKEGEKPVKEADHLNDALRYSLFSIRTIPTLKFNSARIFN